MIAIERMSSTVGKEAIWVMLSSRDMDQQHSITKKFLERELGESRAQMALLNQQDRQRTETLRQQQSKSAGPMRERRRESLKLEISKYRGVEEDSLSRCFFEVDDAIEARRIGIGDEQMQVAFAESYLAGDAISWALNLKLHDLNVLGSLSIFTTLLSETVEPPRAEFRTLSELLQLKQGKRNAHTYAQNVRYLASCMVANPVSEFVLITIFIQGLEDGPIRDHLFREELKTFSEAMYAA